MKRNFRTTCLLLLQMAFCLFFFASSTMAQDDVKEAPSLRLAGEVYRVRVQNVELGSVEISADGGLHYGLIGRVVRPATRTLTERGTVPTGAVLRSGPTGIAFTVGADRVVKLRPQSRPIAVKNGKEAHLPGLPLPSEIVTNMADSSGLFGDLLPPAGTTVRLQLGSQATAAMTNDHSLTTDDVFVLIVTTAANGAAATPDAPQADFAARIAALTRDYLVGAIPRARAEGHTVVTGTLTLQAKLPEDEPDPIAAVTYTVDDTLIAAQNVGPYSFDWNTRRVADGEHLVEISALNRNGRIITHARTLIVVNNGKPAINKR